MKLAKMQFGNVIKPMNLSQNNPKTLPESQKTAVFDLADDAAYKIWRAEKLANYSAKRNESIVTLADMANPQSHEVSQIVESCRQSNMVIYQTDAPILPDTLEKFCAGLGLKTMETHRSAASTGIVSIEQTTIGSKGGYIPYTNKPLSWHTDGYYNAAADRIQAMVLHCVRDATQGGINELFDPDIVYIRLRDENPQFITAMMHPQALTIPANEDPRSDYRPDSIGPVFEVDPASGHLNMRYSARTRNIIWRDDPATDQAREFLTHILKNDPLLIRHKLKSGQGVISNNVLHNRTGFIDASDTQETRLLYRIRYKERVREN